MFAGGGVSPLAGRTLAAGRPGEPDIETTTRSVVDVADDPVVTMFLPLEGIGGRQPLPHD